MVPLSDLAHVTRCQVQHRKPPPGEDWGEALQAAPVDSAFGGGTVVLEAGLDNAEGDPIRVLSRNIRRKLAVRLTKITRRYFLRKGDILLPLISSCGNLGAPVVCLSEPPHGAVPAKNFYLARAKEPANAPWLYFTLGSFWNLESYAQTLADEPEERARLLAEMRKAPVFTLRMTAARTLRIPAPLPYEIAFAQKAFDFLARKENETAALMDELRNVFDMKRRLSFLNDK